MSASSACAMAQRTHAIPPRVGSRRGWWPLLAREPDAHPPPPNLPVARLHRPRLPGVEGRPLLGGQVTQVGRRAATGDRAEGRRRAEGAGVGTAGGDAGRLVDPRLLAIGGEEVGLVGPESGFRRRGQREELHRPVAGPGRDRRRIGPAPGGGRRRQPGIGRRQLRPERTSSPAWDPAHCKHACASAERRPRRPFSRSISAPRSARMPPDCKRRSMPWLAKQSGCPVSEPVPLAVLSVASRQTLPWSRSAARRSKAAFPRNVGAAAVTQRRSAGSGTNCAPADCRGSRGLPCTRV